MDRIGTRASQISDDKFPSEVFIFDRDEDADQGHRPHLSMGPSKTLPARPRSSSRITREGPEATSLSLNTETVGGASMHAAALFQTAGICVLELTSP
jgi:hypothetical protein